MTPARIEAAKNFGRELEEKLANDTEVLDTRKHRAAAASFCIAIDHCAAIVFLMEEGFYSTSFALIRLLFEAYLRGLWLKHCASDEKVSSYFRGEEPPPKLNKMISEIESTEGFCCGTLSLIKKENWDAMCDFTHTGRLHLQWWQSQDAIEPIFSPEALEVCLNTAELYGAMASLERIQMSKSGNDGTEVLQLIKKRWP
jgi:hypothetical protein